MPQTQARRVANARKLMATHGGPTKLALMLGHSNGSFVAQVAGPNPSREISEKVARDWEEKLSLPLGWMDRDNTSRDGSDPTAQALIAVANALDAEEMSPHPSEFSELVAIVRESGSTDDAFIRRMIRLLKSKEKPPT